MAIKVQVAKNADEIKQALRLRHEIYVMEEGRFGGRPLPDQQISDDHDKCGSFVSHILAYHDKSLVGSIRVHQDRDDNGVPRPLPAESAFKFRSCDRLAGCDGKMASAGMLVVHREWRRRRDVTFQLIRSAIYQACQWGAEHLVVTVSAKTESLYRRMGFERAGAPFEEKEIRDELVPLVAKAEAALEWAFKSQFPLPAACADMTAQRHLARANDFTAPRYPGLHHPAQPGYRPIAAAAA